MKIFTFFLLLALCNPLLAQNKVSICSYYGSNAQYKQSEICSYLSFASNQQAEAIVDKTLKQVGLKRNFIVMECPNIQNAMAVNLPSDIGMLRYIIYDNAFLERVNNTTQTDWAAISIMAHEIGHHLNGHSLDGTGSRPQKELEADEFSGFVLFKLGASLNEAQAAMRELQSSEGSATHPPRQDRLNAISKGWSDARELAGNISNNNNTNTNTGQRKGTPNELDPEKEDYATLARQWFAAAYNQKDYNVMIEYYGHAIHYKPDYHEAYFNRAWAKQNQGRHGEAIADLDEAIRIKPDYAEAYYSRGWSNKSMGICDKALPDLDEAIRLKTDYVDAYWSRGYCLNELKNYQAALADLNTAISLKPSATGIYMNRAYTYMQMGYYQQAINDCNIALRLQYKTDLHMLYNMRGWCQQKLGNLQEAINDYNQSLEIKPDYSTARNNLNAVLSSQGQKR